MDDKVNQKIIKLKIEKHCAVIELDPRGSLLFSHSLKEQFKSHIKKIQKNRTIYSVLLLFKNKMRDGVDVVGVEKIHSREKWERLLDEMRELFFLMDETNVSWIAVIQGPCSGEYLELALACDYRIADFGKNTIFELPYLSFGLIPFLGACVRLPALMGLKKAMDMILYSQVICADQAYKEGLLNAVTHPLDLDKESKLWAKKVEEGSIPAKPVKKDKKLSLIDKILSIPIFRELFYSIVRQKILSKTKHSNLASLKFLEVMKKTYPVKSLKLALKEEESAFCDLVISPETIHLISVYRAKQDKVRYSLKLQKSVKDINKTAVIGAGFMGSSITGHLAHYAVPVLLKDIHSPSLSGVLTSVYRDEGQTGKNIFLNKIKSVFNISETKMANKDLLSFIRPQTDYSGFSAVDLAIEAVVEDEQIKAKVLFETCKHLSKTCVLATTTSSCSIVKLAKSVEAPSRFLGLHFFYPVEKTSIVEIVRGDQTNDEAVQTVFRWLSFLGKTPFVVKDAPGFLMGRLFLPLMSEAFWLLREGLNIKQVDQIYTNFGFSLGPFRLMDELGLDFCLNLIKQAKVENLNIAFPDGAEQLGPIFLGKKNRQGFYIYNEKGKVEKVNSAIYKNLRCKPAGSFLPADTSEYLERGLYRMIQESAQVLEERIASSPQDVDLALILGLGFPAFKGGLLKYADQVSLKMVLNGLENLYQNRGPRFKPSPYLLKWMEFGKFYK